MKALNLEAGECLMVGNDATEDAAAELVGMRVFLLTDCLINKEQRDLSGYPRGGFDQLLGYIEKQRAEGRQYERKDYDRLRRGL